MTLLPQRVGKYNLEKIYVLRSILSNFISVTLSSTLYAFKKVC